MEGGEGSGALCSPQLCTSEHWGSSAQDVARRPQGRGNRRNEAAQDELIASSMGNRQVRSVFKWLLLRTSTTILDCHLF